MDAALRDKMLKLMGGCEHEPVMKDFLHLQCQKCYEFWLDGKTKDGNEPPTVGDAHEPTTDELLALVEKLWPYSAVEFHKLPPRGMLAVRLLIPGTADSCMYNSYLGGGDTRSISLALAIDAATK